VPADGNSKKNFSLTSDGTDGQSVNAFEKPKLQKFTDMQDLLLLDPIHEVDEAGWPHTRNDTDQG